MPTDTKTKKLRIKVEEVKNPINESEPQVDASTKNVEKVQSSSSLGESEILVPKVSSFSQLDASIEVGKNLDKPSYESSERISEETNQENAKNTTLQEKNQTGTQKPQLTSEEVKEWLKEVRPDTTKELEKSRGFDLKTILGLAIIFIILGAIVGGVFYYTKGVKKEIPPQIPSAKESPTPTVVITETPKEIDFTGFSLRVLNGSGKAGEAKKVKEILAKEGFKEDKVEIGNAESYDYKRTLVSLKKGIDEKVFEKIKQSLSDYDVVKSDKELEENSLFDIVIIVGSTKR